MFSIEYQGKPSRIIKNRPAVTKPILKKQKIRSGVIPLDRKENLTQPSCSKSGPRLNKCFKAKSRKDLTLKIKNSSSDKAKSFTKIKKTASPVIPQNVTTKLQITKEKPIESDGVRLREICFVKNNEGKRVIAKYDNKDYDDSLVVAWDNSSSKPHIFTHKSRVSSAPPYASNKALSEPGTSKQVGVRAHNFAKSSSTKMKLKKNLRRLASTTDVLGKMEKKKKKKIRSK